MLKTIKESLDLIENSDYSGLSIIIDEFGRFLEFGGDNGSGSSADNLRDAINNSSSLHALNISASTNPAFTVDGVVRFSYTGSDEGTSGNLTVTTGSLNTTRINTPDVLLVNKGASTKYLMAIANGLRKSGIRVINPLNQPSPALDYIPVLISVSSQEESDQTSLVQLTKSKTTDTVPLDQLSSFISTMLGG